MPKQKSTPKTKRASGTRAGSHTPTAGKGTAHKKASPPHADSAARAEQPLAGELVPEPETDQPLMSRGSADTWDYQPDTRVRELIAETETVEAGSQELADELRAHHATSPILSGGDLDADWQDAEKDGEETVGGLTPTPDQDRVDELGEAVGIVYQDEEPLHTTDKLEKRDRERWELNAASGDPGQ